MPRWDADLAISADDARAAIERQFSELSPATLELVGEGWDNLVFRVNGDWVFRFPRREVAVGLLESECLALPIIAPRVPFAVPLPWFVGMPSDPFPRPFLGYRWLDGSPAIYTTFVDAELSLLAGDLGAFLRALHAIAIDHVPGTQEIPRDTIRRLDVVYRRRTCLERIEELVGDGALDDVSGLRHVIDEVPDDWVPDDRSLVHGDLDSRHVLVGEDGRLRSIIDWGDVHRGDPACDLAIVFTFLPARLRDSFLRTYGAVREDVWAIARFRALYHSVNILQYAMEVGDEPLARDAKRRLRNVAS